MKKRSGWMNLLGQDKIKTEIPAPAPALAPAPAVPSYRLCDCTNVPSPPQVLASSSGYVGVLQTVVAFPTSHTCFRDQRKTTMARKCYKHVRC